MSTAVSRLSRAHLLTIYRDRAQAASLSTLASGLPPSLGNLNPCIKGRKPTTLVLTGLTFPVLTLDAHCSVEIVWSEEQRGQTSERQKELPQACLVH